MRWITGVVVVVAVLLSRVAAADEAPPAAEPKMAFGAAAAVWLPSGDVDEFVDTSLGVRGTFAFHYRPFLAIIASGDFVFANEKENVSDITYYTFGAGARLIKSGRALEPYGEFLIGWHHIDGEGTDDSGIGFRLGGGAMYSLSPNLIANAGLSYSAVSIDVGIVDVDVDALVFDVGIAYRLY